MKGFRIIGRNIRDAFKSVFRNFSLSVSSITCITITLIVVSISVILSFNINNFTNLAEKELTIVAFLKVDISEEEILEVEDNINVLNNVESFEFRNKMDISKDMMESYEAFESLMGDWTEEESPIQSTFQVKVTNISKIGEVASEIEKIDNISYVKYGKGMVEQLISVFEIVEKISLAMVIALVVVTAFLISNTIKLTIFSRKREIEIMRLVGASNINIKIPFIFEGLFLGILGSIIPIVITTYGYVELYNMLNGRLFSPFIRLIKPDPFIYYVSLILIVIGIIVGMVGSARAVRKHLKI